MIECGCGIDSTNNKNSQNLPFKHGGILQMSCLIKATIKG